MARRVLRAHREIALVLALFVALGIFYSVTTPLFEAPDEQWHFAFVQNVATGRGLPVQTVNQPTHLARQEGSQPPLYYLLAAAATFWIDTSDYPGIVWENPHYGYNVPGIVNDNKNLFIHTALESFPYHGATLAIHLARLLSVLMGALAVLFTYLLTLEIFPDRKYLAASSAALVAFVPQFLFISSAVSNDSTIVAMSALSLWLVVRLLTKDGKQRTEDGSTEHSSSVLRLSSAIALGAATGLAALAKVSGLGLAILGALVLAWVSFQTSTLDAGGRRRTQTNGFLSRLSAFLRALISFGAVVFLIAGWWYLRNLVLYGELTGTAMMVRIFGARETPLTTMQLLVQLREVWETFWVGFGWGNIRAQPAIYTALEIVVAASGIGLLLAFVRRRDRLRPTLLKALPFFVLAFWIIVAFVELVNWMAITQAPHGRLFFPALPALAPLAAFGLTQWVPQRAQPLVARGAALALLGLAVYAPFAILQPAYAYPAPLTVSESQNLAHRVDINYDNKMKLLGYNLSANRALPGEAVTLTLDWQSLAAMDQDYSIGIHLVDSTGRVIGARDSYPGHGMLPTRLWQPGQMIRDTYWLPLAADAAAPRVASIEVALYSRQDRRDLPAFDPSGHALSTPIIGRLKISAPNSMTPRAQNATQFSFGKQIDLIGYDLNSAKAAQPSPGLDLTLYWKRAAPIDSDYTVFVHVLDSTGKVVDQKDIQPAQGDNPTSLWDDGEIVPDEYKFSLPSGAYRVEIGLYREQTGERLPVTDAKGNTLGDHVTLSVEVGQ